MNDQQNLPHEERLGENIVGLTQLCYDIVSDAHKKGYHGVDPTLLDVASNVLSRWDKKNLIDRFITKSHMFWEQIRNKDESFFRKNMGIVFDGLPLVNVDEVAKLFETQDDNGLPIVLKEDRDAIWDFLNSMTKICIKYIHDQRGPILHKVNSDYRPFYSKSFFPEIRLESYASKFGIKLIFS
jgi:hypothetical protein